MPSLPNLTLTPAADDDFAAIVQHLAEMWGEQQATKYANDFDNALERIARFPGLGMQRDDLVIGLRAVRVGQHVSFYQATEDGIVVQRIIHERRGILNEFRA